MISRWYSTRGLTTTTVFKSRISRVRMMAIWVLNGYDNNSDRPSDTILSSKCSKDFCAWKSLDVSKWIDCILCIVLKIKHIIIANDHEFTSTAPSPASNIEAAYSRAFMQVHGYVKLVVDAP